MNVQRLDSIIRLFRRILNLSANNINCIVQTSSKGYLH